MTAAVAIAPEPVRLIRLHYLGYVAAALIVLVAALVLVTLMTIQGLGYLLPTSVRICLELQKAEPDGAKIGRVMSRFYDVVASQGVMQVAIIVVMARLATGV